jgi:hypothetical protein
MSAIGAHGSQYLEHENECTWIESREMYFVDRYFDENGIVYLEDTNEHAHRDDALFLDNRSEWVSSDCSYAVYCEGDGEHQHIDDCVLLDDGTYALRDDNESEAAA